MGPVELMVLAFPDESPTRHAVAALRRLDAGGDVRIVDVLFVSKHADGDIVAAELEAFEDMDDVVAAELSSLLGPEDAMEVGETLDPGTCALLVLVEHVWAAEAAEALRESGAVVAARINIPAEHLEAAEATSREA